MGTDAEMMERHARGLAELTELGLSLARDLHACALAEPDPKTKAETALAFHRVSRSVRQSMALEARLKRDLARQDREGRAEAVQATETRVRTRRAQVGAAMERLIWTEAENDEEAERLVDELGEHLDEAALHPDFADDPVEVHVARLRADLGLSGGAEASGQPPTWRSSA
jgi:phosphate-selective porin